MILNKSIFKIILFVVAVCSITACTSNFDDINKNPYGVTGEELEREGYNVGASLSGLQSFVIPTKEHLHQFHEVLAGSTFAGYLSNTPTWTEKFSTYNPPVDWARAPFNDVIVGIYPYYEQMHAVTDDKLALSLAKLMRVASMHRLTDTFGPIPYTKMSSAGGGEAENGEVSSLTAPYDSQETIYKQMILELNEVIDVLTENSNTVPNFSSFDKVYSGNIPNWVRFANSLKLRLAMRMSYVEPVLARQTAEEAISNPIGVIINNTQNAQLTVSSTNPMYRQVVEWGDERASADIVTYMNSYNDPRRAKYFEKSTFAATSAITNSFYGLRNGIDVANKDEAMMYSRPIVSDTSPIMWMNAAEVAFLRAEGALRGWAMGDAAENLYNEGIRLSFTQHGATGVEDYIKDNTSTPTGYIDPLGTYTYSGASSSVKILWSSSATFEQNLERIITQKWIAIFPLAIEAWSEFRRTGYPRLMPVVKNKSGGKISTVEMVRRLPFPDTEYTENTDNLYQAIEFLGGPDTGGTKLWWDKK